ncbi:RNA polymerase sigma factor [Nonlabens sp. Asnod3-H03]|uniref:RNA polymerase sigma factor n=1 Tax=Nonlabens sp. Asnod3-H03 TaxID=3160580 RepID=UPI00386AADF2
MIHIERDFKEIYNKHSDKVYRLCIGYAAGNEDLAKDWHQETFIKVWNHRKSFKGDSSISTWIYRIAVNTCLSDLRTPKRKVTTERLVSDQTDSNEISEDRTGMIQKMYHCINQLTSQNKTLILMELEEIPQSTIANTTGLEHGALRTRLSRIRKSLLKCIKNG